LLLIQGENEMPLAKGHSQEVVSHNIKEMIRSGYKPKQAIAASLANARKYKKMAKGGLAQNNYYADGGSVPPPRPQPTPTDQPPITNTSATSTALSSIRAALGKSDGGEIKGKTLGQTIGYPGMADGGEVDDDEDMSSQKKPSNPWQQVGQSIAHLSDGGQVVAKGGMGDIPGETEGPSGGREDKYMGNRMKNRESEYEDEDTDPLSEDVMGAGLNKNESMSEMDRKGPEDYQRSLNEIREDGEYYPSEVANPNEQDEERGFAAALRRQANSVLSPENYAFGGMVEDGPEGDEPVGNKPSEGDDKDSGMDSTMREDAMTPMQADGLEHSKMDDPSGNGLSKEAMEAIRMKRKSRRYGMYNPR
jgi:hypothetical protein